MLNKIVILLFLSGINYGYGQANDIAPRIVGGTPAVAGEYPSTVAIFTPATTFCVGVILNDQHIVTSARCLHNANRQVVNPFWLRIIAGDLNINVPSYRRFTTNVSHIFIHPQYSPTANDLAVLRLGVRFPFPHNTIDIARRNNRVLAQLTECRFAGWGANAVGGPLAAILQSVAAPILSRDACNAANVHQGRVLESMICAGSLVATVPPSGVCEGNLGGGLFCNNELTGILSFGIGCGVANNPGVYTQIRFYSQWIDSTFTSNNATQPGVTV